MGFEEIYRHEQFLFPYKKGLHENPFYIDIEITNACNLDCIMCNRQLMKRAVGFMDLTTFHAIVEQTSEFTKPRGMRFVRQGEPTLHKGLPSMIRYAHARGILTFVSTNGLLLDEAKVGALLTSGLDEIRFSMQGTDAQEYARMRNADAYDQFEQAIRLFRKRRDAQSFTTVISLSTSVTDEPQEVIDAFLAYWKHIVDRVCVDKTTFSRLEDLPVARQHLKRQTFQRAYKPCTEVMTKLSVNWNGDVSACCKDYNGELILGNVKEKTLLEIWRSAKLNALRETVGEKLHHARIPLCKDCYQVTTKFDDLKEQFEVLSGGVRKKVKRHPSGLVP